MLRLRTLGTIDLQREDGEELRAVLAQPKRIGLLAFLALSSPIGWQRRDRLIALFWPELDTERARNALNQAIFFLRRHLGSEAILTRNAEEVAVATDILWCDATAFAETIAAGEFREAIELYRGELLASFHVPDAASDLERWIDTERSRLGRLYRGALEKLALEREAASDFATAVTWWRRLAADDPHDAHTALGLMRALAAAGDLAGALEHARVYSVLVREELEIEPDPRITALADRLRNPAAAAATRPATRPRTEGESDATTPPSTSPLTDAPERLSSAPRVWRHVSPRIRVTVALALAALVALAYRARPGHADPTVQVIAVLPFDNLTNDPSKEFLADVMTDVLITELARYHDLTVKSRMTVLQFKSRKPSAAEIAKLLGVDAFVEGTISGDGRMLQLNAQLINARNDRHLWAERYVRDSTNALTILGDVAAAIAREVNLYARIPADPPRNRPPLNAVSYSLYLRGQSEMLSRTPIAMRNAATYFRQSIAQDSTFAPGYAGLSEVYLISGHDGYVEHRPAIDSARAFATRAIALDSLLPEAHTALAAVYDDGAKWQDAEREYQRAIDLGPSYALARHWYAHMLATQGRIQEAYAQISVGRTIDPISASLARTAGPIETMLGLSRPTSTRASQAVLRDPLHAWSRATYANRLAEEKKCDQARANIDTARSMIKDNIRMEMQVFSVEYRCGDRATAMKMFDALKQRRDARSRGLWIATVYKTLGQPDSAYAWLDSVEWNGDLRFNFRTAPVWRAARNEPRYALVLKKMGL